MMLRLIADAVGALWGHRATKMGASMLTDAQARKAKPQDRDYKLADSLGLYLFVTRSGSKSWRMKYRFGKQEKRLTFGLYPEVSLGEARGRRDEARKLLRDNTDPAIEKQKARLDGEAKAAQTFEKVAREWHAAEAPRWGEVHASDVIRSLERDIFPDLGKLPITQIDAPLVLRTLRKVEARGSIETARRGRQRIASVFSRAKAEGLTKDNPAADLSKALKPLPKKGRQPSIVDGIDDPADALDAARKLLTAAEDAGATPVTKLASRFLALTAQRPGMIRGVQWPEFEAIDWDVPAAPGSHPDALWRVPASRMKLILDRKDEVAFEHLVALSWQAVAVLQAVRRLTGRADYVFPSQRHSHKPISENAIGYLYNRVGYHGRHVPHGWRAAFSTIMNEMGERAGRHSDRKVIDLMLAHVPENKVEGAYNRAAHMVRRREIAAEWADGLCEGLNKPGDLLEMPRR
jgi:integrase